MTKTEQQTTPSFILEKVYVKDLSFEVPDAPAIFLKQDAPELNIQMDITHKKIEDEDLYEVVLPLEVTAKVDDKTYFLAEVHQAGLFTITGVSEENLPAVLEVNCPDILLPFAREAVASMIGRGGFPAVLINPVNFEVLFHQRHAAEPESGLESGNGSATKPA